MKALTGCLVVALLGGAFAASGDYDYAVEYVKSTRGSVVRTDLKPELGLMFRMEIMIDGAYTQMFGGKFDHAKDTTAIFGAEGDKFDNRRSLYAVEIGGNDGQARNVFMNFGRKEGGPWEHCGYTEVGDNAFGTRLEITYDEKKVHYGSYTVKLNGERKFPVNQPISFFGKTCADGRVKSFKSYDLTFYGATFFKNQKKVAAFVPVVKGGVAGLYETVGKKFYSSCTAVPLAAGPKKKVEKVGGGGDGGGRRNGKFLSSTSTQNFDYSLPIFEDDFSNEKVFAERWDLVGHSQKDIWVKDGAARIPSGATGDGIRWKGELPDECAVEAELVCYPSWSEKKDPKDGDYHWASMGCDYGNFGVRSDGYGVCLYNTGGAGESTRGCYPWIADFNEQQPTVVRFERRKLGESMVSYAYFLNGVQVYSYNAPAPQKKVGFDGVARGNPLTIDNFQCPFDVRRVTVYAIKGDCSPNLVSNSGFEYDDEGVPPHFCNRNGCDFGKASAADYTEKYLKSFMVDKKVKHSGKQSLRLLCGSFLREHLFYAWGTPTQKGKSAVFSVWAKASEPGVDFRLKLGNERKMVRLTTDWTRYEVTTTNMPAPGIFSPVWLEVPEIWKHAKEFSVWVDDLQLEMVEPPVGGFDSAKTYATKYQPKAGDAERFSIGKPTPHPKPTRKTPLTPAENALNGYALKEGEELVLGHYDFYMNEPMADFRVWDAKGGFEQVSADISKLAPGEHELVVKALGREWKTKVRKLAYRKGATQISQWARCLVHDGKPVFVSAPCLIGRENGTRPDGSSTQVDALTGAGFKHLSLQNNMNVRDIEMNVKTLAYARQKGMKFIVWEGEGELNEVGDIREWKTNKPTDWTRQKMHDMLYSGDVLSMQVLDEPEGRDPNKVRAFMKRERARFPYTPVQMNNSWFGIAGRFAGLPTDILMVDFYLTNDGTTLNMVVGKVDVLRSIAPGKPCWYFMESVNSIHQRIPSYREQIAQCWGLVAAGASGLSWFVNMPTARNCWDAMVDFNREALDNNDFLCSDELCGGAVASETENYIRCLTRRRANEWRIYAVNVNPHRNKLVAFKLPADIPSDAKIEVLYENRTLRAKKGLFGDSFDGYARHIYKIRRGGIPASPACGKMPHLQGE